MSTVSFQFIITCSPVIGLVLFGDSEALHHSVATSLKIPAGEINGKDAGQRIQRLRVGARRRGGQLLGVRPDDLAAKFRYLSVVSVEFARQFGQLNVGTVGPLLYLAQQPSHDQQPTAVGNI